MAKFDNLTDENTPDNSTETFAEIGKVIALWADIDEKLFDVFEKLVGTRRQVASILYFEGANGVSKRIDLTRQIAKVVLDATSYTALETLLSEIKPRAEFRNKIAHNPVLSSVRFNGHTANIELALTSLTSPNKSNQKNAVRHAIEDMKSHILAMAPLFDRLRAFPEMLASYKTLGLEEKH